jgi:hypothetical protein
MATITKSQALSSLEPNAIWTIEHTGGGDVITWNSEAITQPTQSAIDTEIARLQVIEDGIAYQAIRAPLYAELKEQLDLLYHDMASDKGDKTGEWFKAVKKVKDDNPKP